MRKKRLPHEFEYYVLLFFLLAFAGWLWEVILYVFTEHAFINRGVYRGPYLPIYGVGGLLLCLLFSSYRKKPVRVFFFIDAALFCLGVFDQLFSGKAFWREMVGLQRAFFECQRKNLPARGSDVRAVGECIGMPVFTLL